MSFFKKTSAAILASAIAFQGQASAAGFANAAYVTGAQTSYSAPKELKKVVNLEAKVVSVLDKASKSALAGIKDAKLRKFYSDVNASKKASLKSLFSELRSGMKYEFTAAEAENAKDMLRYAVKGYAEFIKEVRAAAGGVAVTADEKAFVETELVEFQRDLVVDPLREIVDTYAKSDVKETGEWKGSVKTPYGIVNASLDRYTSFLSIMGLSQEIDFVFNADFDLDLPGPTKYDPETYEALPSPSVKTKGAVKIDANVKVVDQTVYLLLRDYSIDVAVSGSGTEDAAKELADKVSQAKTSLDLLKGKTVSVELPEDESAVRPDAVLKKLTETLAVLDNESVFTPARKIGENRYALALKPETAAKISKIFEQKLTKKDVARADKELAASNFAFEKNDGSATVSATDPHGSGDVRMTRDASGYAFRFNNVQPQSRGSLELSKTSAKLVSHSKTADVLGTWNDGALDLTVTVSGTEAFKASGTLTKKKADLTFAVSGKQVGTVKYEKNGKDYSSSISVEFEIPAGFSGKEGKFSFESAQKGTVESGTFPISVPKDVIDLETLMK